MLIPCLMAMRMNVGGKTSDSSNSRSVLEVIMVLARITLVVFLLAVRLRESLFEAFDYLIPAKPRIGSVPYIDRRVAHSLCDS